MDTNGISTKITASIIAALESGNVRAWVKPWKNGLPTNAKTGRPYTGINVLIGAFTAMDSGFSSPLWATFNQWRDLGAMVQKGSKGTHMVMYKVVAKTDKTDKVSTYRLSRTFVVFNADQVSGFALPAAAVPATREDVEAFMVATKANLSWGGDTACYIPSQDRIQLPPRDMFFSNAALYATAFHELTHWTGAPLRLNRDLSGRFGTELYAMEELVAELAAAMLCAHFGVGVESELRKDHAAYLSHWLKVLRADPSALFAVASKASEAMGFLLGLSDQIEEATEEAA